MNGASRDGSWTSQASPSGPSGLRRAKPSVWYCFAIFGGIGRYRASDYKETCVCIRGHFEEYMYGFAETRSDGTPDPNSFGIVETVDMFPGGPIMNI